MNIRYLFKCVGIDDRTRKYIEKRLHVLEKLLGKLLEIEVEIELDKKGKFRVDLMACTPYHRYRVEEVSESIEGAIDVAESDIREQILKDKGKRETLKKRGRISLKKKMVLDDNARF
jgi:ribosomal subunit interface protein